MTVAYHPRKEPQSKALLRATLRYLLTGAEVGEADRYQKIGLDFEAVDRMRVNVFLQAHEPAPKQIVLDLDSTDDPLHGEQGSADLRF